MFKSIYYLTEKTFSKLCRKNFVFNAIVCIGKDSSVSYDDLLSRVRFAYLSGARTLRFDGYPQDWSDGTKNIEHLVIDAKRLGFAEVSLFCEIGKLIDVRTKNIRIQIDDFFLWSEEIKNKFIKNIAATKNKNIIAFFTVRKDNCEKLLDVVKFVTGNPKIKALGFTFHNNDCEEDKYVDAVLRAQVVDSIMKMKRLGFPILNTMKSLLNEKQENRVYKDQTLVFDTNGEKYFVADFSALTPLISNQM